MADCERALGRPHNALKLAKESHRLDLDPALRIEMIIVEAGARADLGQGPEARRILDQRGRVAPRRAGLAQPTARLHYAYADALLAADQPEEARRWFAAAAELDAEREPIPSSGVDELDGMLIDFDEDDDNTEVRTTPVSGSAGAGRRLRRGAVRPGRRGLSRAGRRRRGRRRDRRFCGPRDRLGFVTNNAARPPAAVAEHLAELGIEAAPRTW